MRSFYAVAMITMTAAIVGCGTAPKRPVFDAPDQVQQFSAQAVVGTWDVTILNALEGEQVSSLVYTYNPDGSWQAHVSQLASGMDIVLEGVGRWEISGEELIGTMDDVEIITDNPLVKLMGGVMKASMVKSSGRINPYEITDNRMVWLTEENQALQLDRRI